jgi:hypothetical protein
MTAQIAKIMLVFLFAWTLVSAGGTFCCDSSGKKNNSHNDLYGNEYERTPMMKKKEKIENLESQAEEKIAREDENNLHNKHKEEKKSTSLLKLKKHSTSKYDNTETVITNKTSQGTKEKIKRADGNSLHNKQKEKKKNDDLIDVEKPFYYNTDTVIANRPTQNMRNEIEPFENEQYYDMPIKIFEQTPKHSNTKILMGIS